jgi:hypothetical protein
MDFEKVDKYMAQEVPGIIKVGHAVPNSESPQTFNRLHSYSFEEVSELFVVDNVKAFMDQNNLFVVAVYYTSTIDEAQFIAKKLSHS